MHLTRQNFGTETTTVMDQVARLVFVAESVISFGPTIVKSEAFSEAESEAREVVKYAENVSTDLLAALFHSNKNRSTALNVAYKKANAGFEGVFSATMKLVAIERAATDGQGKIIAGGAVAQLQYLKQFWDTRSAALAA